MNGNQSIVKAACQLMRFPSMFSTTEVRNYKLSQALPEIEISGASKGSKNDKK